MKCHKVVTSEAPFLLRDGQKHLRCAYPWRDGQAEWAWINTGMADPPKVVTNPSTNRARRSLTLLM